MNTTNCEIIQDLLPLYADGGLSRESAELVEAHIAECDECKALLEQMKKETKIEVPAVNVSAPVNSIKKQVFGVMATILGGILAVAVIAFSVISIKYAWPVLHGYMPMRYEDLTITAEGDNVVIDSKGSDFRNILYYVYRLNDDGTISMFVSFGDAKKQYNVASSSGNGKSAWTWTPLAVKGEPRSNGSMDLDTVGGALNEDGRAGGDGSFDWPTKITLSGNVREIYYVQNISEPDIQEWLSAAQKNWRAVTEKFRRMEPYGESVYELISMDGFDFDSLGDAILIWSAE
ncbi:MAG: zf-HC2 domain-containing protein [Firmicutes bacterium]|nr:zf-HC2 domain-containing protein [Bacillota bacterium]